MRWLRGAFDEVLGLFVDDAAFAIPILAWLAAVGALSSAVPTARGWLAPMLFIGLAVILTAGVLRKARR